MSDRIELLAPAGSKEQLIASIENGADAVYLGGRFYNARESAEGFSDEDMKKALSFAHLRGAKIYVTMNTLVNDDELEEGYEYAKALYKMGVDALIIQDLGLGKLIHDRLPELPLHLSTQASIYGPGGVKTAAELGYSRVVFARELTMDEMREATDQARSIGMETEAFCHGALCVCYSGECQLSRFNGGRSGNRGECAQPCRLRYRTSLKGGAALTENISDYPLSPRDLSLIDHLGRMIDIGVTSLKIEGRLKSPEYSAIVTKIYRKYIDEYLEKRRYKVSDEDRDSLAQIFSRGESPAYFAGVKGRDLMVTGLSKHQGIRIGTVVGRKDSQLIGIKLERDIDLGDGIEIRSKELTGNVITYIKEGGAESKKPKDRASDRGAKAGSAVIVGDIRGDVKKGDIVYRISSKKQLDDARATFEGIDLESDKGERKLPISLELGVTGKGLLLKAETENGISAEYWRDLPENAGSGGYGKERLIKALSKTGSTTFSISGIEIGDEVLGYIMKVSEVNELRRKVLDKLREKILAADDREINEEAGADEEKEAAVAAKPEKDDLFWGKQEQKRVLELFFDSWNDFTRFGVSERARELLKENGIDIQAVLPLVDVIKNANKLVRVKFIPYISSITKGREDAFLKRYFDAVLAVVKQTGVYVGTLEWVAPLLNEGVTVKADYGLGINNHKARELFEGLGIDEGQYSLEQADSMEGAYPLMTLEHSPEGDILTDEAGRELIIERRDYSDQTLIKPGKTESFDVLLAHAIKGYEENGFSTQRIYI